MLLASMGDADVLGGPRAVRGASDATTADVARPYDFRYPDKFSRDQIRTVQAIHDTFGRLVSNTFGAQARANITVQFSSIDQMPFSEYIQRLDEQTCIFVVSAEPLSGHYVIEMDMTAAMHILDRLQGGSGRRPRIPDGKEVTDIERALMASVGRWLVRDFIQAWREIVRFQATEGDLQLQTYEIRQILGSEVSLAIVYDVHLFDQVARLSVALPGSTLEPIMSRLSATVLFSAASPRSKRHGDNGWTEIADPMGKVSLPVSVNLGRAILTMADIADLRVGDVIVTDQDVHAALELAVSDEALFNVRPGRLGSRMAAQVVGIVPNAGPLPF